MKSQDSSSHLKLNINQTETCLSFCLEIGLKTTINYNLLLDIFGNFNKFSNKTWKELCWLAGRAKAQEMSNNLMTDH